MTEAAIITGEVRKIAATRLAEANQDWRSVSYWERAQEREDHPYRFQRHSCCREGRRARVAQATITRRAKHARASAGGRSRGDQKPLPGMGEGGLSRAVRAFPCRKLIDNPAAPFVDCEFCLGLRKHTSPSLIPSPEIQEDDYDKHSRLEAAISDQMDVIQQLTTEKSKMRRVDGGDEGYSAARPRELDHGLSNKAAPGAAK